MLGIGCIYWICSTDEQVDVNKPSSVVENDKMVHYSVHKFEYEEHEYISFSKNRHENGIVHNTDCKYCHPKDTVSY